MTVYLLLNEVQVKDSNSRECYKKFGCALFYGIASFMLTVVNKSVLTSWHFPSFWVLSVGQVTATIFILCAAKQSGKIAYPNCNTQIVRDIFPLPLIHFGNMVFGLGATQALSLPMFSSIRQISVLMTMFLEFRMLGIIPSRLVQISVWSMVGGALLAASDDISFNIHGYTYIMIANAITAANGVLLKKKLDTLDMGKYGIMFYNSLIILVPILIGTYLFDDLYAVYNFAHWKHPMFIIEFFISCVMGFVLTYSTILCTQYNSALTTSIIGCLKNICVTYLGMFIGGDYIFSWLNSIGINISILSSIFYTYITFNRMKPTEEKVIFEKTVHV